jgi:hydrogenase maturation protease
MVALGAVVVTTQAWVMSTRRPHSGRVEAAVLAPLVVVGLGNEIASDDGVGICVARNLAIEYEHRTDVEVVALPWAGFALLDVLRDRQRAALVDCLVTGTRPPGSIVHLDASDFAGSVRLNSFHDISYPAAMDLGRALGWQIPVRNCHLRWRQPSQPWWTRSSNTSTRMQN